MIYKTLNMQWLGHSSFRIKSLGLVIYIDPFKISEESEAADFIFITHSHFDHCSIEDIQKIAVDGTTIIAPADVSSKFRHISKKLNLIIAEPGEGQVLVGDKLRFWAVQAYNLGKNYHTREEDWVGYIVQIGEEDSPTLVYHAGDTDIIPEMKNIKNIDIAILPIGGVYTMNAGEAAKAASIIRPRIAVPMHYGSLDKTGSKSDANIFAKFCSSEGIEVRILERED